MRKRNRLDIKKIIRENRAVNASKFGEAMNDLESLRRNGVQPKQYSLPMPFSKGLHVIRITSSDDPRTVRLGRP